MNALVECLSQASALASACADSGRDWVSRTFGRGANARFRSSARSEEDDDIILNPTTPLLSSRRPALQEELTMSPIEKFIKYRRIPFKLIANVTVVCLITAFMINDNLQYASFVNASSDGFRILLQNDNYDTLQGKTRVYSYDQFTNMLGTATAAYFEYPTTCLYPIQVDDDIEMKLHYLNGTTREFTLSPSNTLGPFSDPSSVNVRYLLNDLMKISVLYPFESVQSSYAGSGQYSDLLYTWQCEGIYDFSAGGGSITYFVDISASVTNSDHSILMKLDVCIIIMVIFSIILTARAFRRSYRVFTFARDALKRKPALTEENKLVWSEIPLTDKMTFFNLWHFSTMVAGWCVSACL
jgi:mucolipin 3